MSGKQACNLTGDWHGMYNYPDGSPSVPFEASIRDEGGALIGSIREVDDYVGPAMLEATIDGSREGRFVRFSKFYDTRPEDPEFDFDFVVYEGEVSDDGREVQGEWHIPGVWSGSFIMVRPGGAAAEIERMATQSVSPP